MAFTSWPCALACPGARRFYKVTSMATECLGSPADKFGLNWFVVYYPGTEGRG